MDLNATLLAQMITFMLFVWFTMKYVWPPLVKALEERKKRIADGLAAAERGNQQLAQAEQAVAAKMRELQSRVDSIIDDSNKRAAEIVERAKEQAEHEAKRMLETAQQDFAREVVATQKELRDHLALLTVQVASKILQKEVNTTVDEKMLQQMLSEI